MTSAPHAILTAETGVAPAGARPAGAEGWPVGTADPAVAIAFVAFALPPYRYARSGSVAHSADRRVRRRTTTPHSWRTWSSASVATLTCGLQVRPAVPADATRSLSPLAFGFGSTSSAAWCRRASSVLPSAASARLVRRFASATCCWRVCGSPPRSRVSGWRGRIDSSSTAGG